MSDAVTPSEAIRAKLRSAFAIARALGAGPLGVPDLPDNAPLADVLRAAAVHGDWRVRFADAGSAVMAPLDAAAKATAAFAAEIETLQRVAAHLTSGDPLDEAADGSLLLAARVLAGSPEGIATARRMQRDIDAARREHAAVASEVARARSAATIAVASAGLDYMSRLGMQGSADEQRMRAAWSSAVAAHRALRAEQRARRRRQEEAA